MTAKRNLLKGMLIREISLVDEGANEGARVLIVKMKGDFKNCDECTGATAPLCKAKGKCMGKGGPGEMMTKFRDRLEDVLKEFSPDTLAKALAGADPAELDAVSMAASYLKEIIMDMETLQKSLEAANANIEKMTADHAAAIAAKDAEITKAKTDAAEAISKAKGTTPEQDEEEFLKSLPAGARTKIEKERAEAKETRELVEKMASEKENDVAIAKAKTFGVGKADEVGPLLVRVAKNKATKADVAALEKLLTVAGRTASPLFKARGTGEGDETSDNPEAALQAKADDIQKNRKKEGGGAFTAAEAYDLALSENSDLYNQYVAKRRGPAALPQ